MLVLSQRCWQLCRCPHTHASSGPTPQACAHMSLHRVVPLAITPDTVSMANDFRAVVGGLRSSAVAPDDSLSAAVTEAMLEPSARPYLAPEVLKAAAASKAVCLDKQVRAVPQCCARR